LKYYTGDHRAVTPDEEEQAMPEALKTPLPAAKAC
jgi:hypothetical protein